MLPTLPMSPASAQLVSASMRNDLRQTFAPVAESAPVGVSDDRSALLQRAFHPSGGTATGDEITLFLRAVCDQPVSLLARWIVQRRVVSFLWRSQRLIPMFQFDIDHCCVRAGIAETIGELSAAFDDLEIISWFAKPNGWLKDEAPADVVLRDKQAVLQAARADRFIVLG